MKMASFPSKAHFSCQIVPNGCRCFPPVHLGDCGAHVVVNAVLRDVAEDVDGVVVGIKQHLMGLLRVSPEHEGAALGELEVGDLQPGPLAADDRPVLRRMTLNNSMLITPLPSAQIAGMRFQHESNLDGKIFASRVNSQ
jgi:hypothetical protein